MSNHEAIVFNLNVGNKPIIEDIIKRSIFQSNVKGLKTDLLKFQNQFQVSDPYVEEHWSYLRSAINDVMNKCIPHKTSTDLPWLTHSIKNKV